MDPETALADHPYFEVIVDLLTDNAPALRHGMTCQVACPGGSETVGTILFRRFMRFVNEVLKA